MDFSLSKIQGCFLALAIIFSLLLTATRPALAQTESVFYSFDGTYGGFPQNLTLVIDKNGNFYGTTPDGGTYGAGTVFEVTASGNEMVLHSFEAEGTDGYYPFASLVLDKKGNLYGTTYWGGTYGYGTVFMVTPSGTETILHSFDRRVEGYWPTTSLVIDKQGNLYGTTNDGGIYDNGTVFMVTPSGTATVLHKFNSDGTDGYKPNDGLILDAKGDLLGSTMYGGAYGGGTVFELTASGTEKILWNFDSSGTDGYYPCTGLVRDKKGYLYGATNAGGANTYGTVFQMKRSGKKEKTLFSFNPDNGTDGDYPTAALVLDQTDNLYGMTPCTFGIYGYGTVFEVTPSGTETVLHSFNWDGTDGYYPYGGLVFDKLGNLYGTTVYGGAHDFGTVDMVTP